MIAKEVKTERSRQSCLDPHGRIADRLVGVNPAVYRRTTGGQAQFPTGLGLPSKSGGEILSRQ
jgi:hypothetical protein